MHCKKCNKKVTILWWRRNDGKEVHTETPHVWSYFFPGRLYRLPLTPLLRLLFLVHTSISGCIFFYIVSEVKEDSLWWNEQERNKKYIINLFDKTATLLKYTCLDVMHFVLLFLRDNNDDDYDDDEMLCVVLAHVLCRVLVVVVLVVSDAVYFWYFFSEKHGEQSLYILSSTSRVIFFSLVDGGALLVKMPCAFFSHHINMRRGPPSYFFGGLRVVSISKSSLHYVPHHHHPQVNVSLMQHNSRERKREKLREWEWNTQDKKRKEDVVSSSLLRKEIVLTFPFFFGEKDSHKQRRWWWRRWCSCQLPCLSRLPFLLLCVYTSRPRVHNNNNHITLLYFPCTKMRRRKKYLLRFPFHLWRGTIPYFCFSLGSKNKNDIWYVERKYAWVWVYVCVSAHHQNNSRVIDVKWRCYCRWRAEIIIMTCFLFFLAATHILSRSDGKSQTMKIIRLWEVFFKVSFQILVLVNFFFQLSFEDGAVLMKNLFENSSVPVNLLFS